MMNAQHKRVNRRQMLAASAWGAAGALILGPRAGAIGGDAPASPEEHDSPQAAVGGGGNLFQKHFADAHRD